MSKTKREFGFKRVALSAAAVTFGLGAASLGFAPAAGATDHGYEHNDWQQKHHEQKYDKPMHQSDQKMKWHDENGQMKEGTWKEFKDYMDKMKYMKSMYNQTYTSYEMYVKYTTAASQASYETKYDE